MSIRAHSHTNVSPSINAVGVDIAPLSAVPNEEEVLLLPGIPMVNLAGENPEEDLWTFELEVPRCATVVIDYVHPGTCDSCWVFFLKDMPVVSASVLQMDALTFGPACLPNPNPNPTCL